MMRYQRPYSACLAVAICVLWLHVVELYLVKPALADDEGSQTTQTITISELSLPCQGCELRSEEPCMVLLGEKLESCEAARLVLLESIKPETYQEKNPTVAELRRYLLSSPVSLEEATAIFALLLVSPVGQKALLQDSYAFADRYPKAMAAAITKQSAPKELLLEFWKLPSKEGVKIQFELRAALAAQIPDLSATEILEDLSLSDLKHTISELTLYQASFKQTKPELERISGEALRLVELCQSIDSCMEVSLDTADPAVRHFIEKLRLHYTIKDITSQKLHGLDVAEALAKTPWQSIRTPESHRLLKETFDDYATFSAAERADFLSENLRQMMETYSANDTAISYHYGVVLFTFAQELWDAEKEGASVPYLERSLAVYPASIPGRDTLTNLVIEWDGWNAHETLRQSSPRISEFAKKKRPIFGLTKSQVAGLVVVLGGISILWIVGGILYRSRRIAEHEAIIEDQEIIDAAETELRELLRYFGVQDGCSLTDLSKGFRRKAKETHPDASGGNDAKFTFVQERYNRARILLTELRGYNSTEGSEEEEDDA